MKRVLLTYHVETREKLICDMIKTYIEENFSEIDVLVSEFYEYLNSVYSFLPDVIYTFFPRDQYSSERLTFLKIISGAYVIAVPTEGLMYFDKDSMERLIGYNRYSSNLVDSYCCWGKRMIEAIKPLLFEHGKANENTSFNVFGYLPYDVNLSKEEIFKKISNSEMLKRNYSLYLEKCNLFSKTVMFIMGFHNADITIEERIKEGYFNSLDDEEIVCAKKKSYANKYYKGHYLSILEKCINTNKDTLFVLKLHPVEIDDYVEKGIDLYSDFRNYDNVIILEDPIPIAAYFETVDTVVHYGSTTGLEAYIHKIPTIQLINDYEDTSCGGMGLKYFESTASVPISLENEAVELVSKFIKYRIISQNEDFLYSVMNYSSSTSYEPTRIICDLIVNSHTPAIIKNDGSCNILVKSKDVRIFLRHYIVEAFLNLIKGNVIAIKNVKMIIERLIRFEREK